MMIFLDLKVRRLITAGYMLLILALSLHPVLDKQPESWFREMVHNLMHAPAYGLMAFFVLLSWDQTHQWERRSVLGTALVCFGYGVLIEILQGFVPGRNPSLLDITLNTLGIGAALWLMTRFKLYEMFNEHH